MPIQHINGGYGGLYCFKIDIKYKNIDISIYLGINELSRYNFAFIYPS